MTPHLPVWKQFNSTEISMHIHNPTRNTETICLTNTAASKSKYASGMSVENLCTQTRYWDSKISVFKRKSFWKNKCLQPKISAGFFFCFFYCVLLEATEVRPTCHLLEMWALVHLKANPRWTQIYIYSLSFVNSPSIRGTRYNFMATARMRKIKHGSELRADITWTLHNLLCWHVPWFFPKQNNVWSAQQAREKRIVTYIYKTPFYPESYTENHFMVGIRQRENMHIFMLFNDFSAIIMCQSTLISTLRG